MTHEDPLVAHHVTAEDAAALTTAVDKLRSEVHARSVGFLIALVLIVALGIAVAVIGWRSEHFLTCQVGQNTEFRNAAATERAAQRHLFDTILNPASTQADRLKATQDYYAGLIAADQQLTDAAGNC
jgi:cytoskeletal protein RodZ